MAIKWDVHLFNKKVIESASDDIYASDPYQLRDALCKMGYKASIKWPPWMSPPDDGRNQ